MVRVDMNPARQAISKRRLRRRRIAARRLARLKRTQQRELIAAEEARQARCAAVAKWTEAEKQRERELAHTPPSQPSRKPVVRFSADVMITKIPHDVAQQLPEPVSSPMAPAAVDSAELLSAGDAGSLTRTAKFVTVGEDWSDEDSDDEEGDPEFVLVDDEKGVNANVHRRIQPIRVATAVASQHDVGRAHGEPHADGLVECEVDSGDDDCNETSDHSDMDSKSYKGVPNASNSSTFKNRSVQAKLNKRTGFNIALESNAKVARSAIKATASLVTATGIEANHIANAASVSMGSPESRKKKRMIDQQNGGPLSSSSPNTGPSPAVKKYKLPSNSHLAHASNASLANGNNSSRNSDNAENRADEEEIESMFDGLVKQKAARKATRAAKLEKDAVTVGDGAKGKVEGMKRGKDDGPRYTEDGLRIVTYEEMAADQPKGLNGPCPFDCSCCF